MKTLRRISIMLTFCFIIAFAACANAQIVQVADTNAATLVEKSNIVFSMLNIPLRLTNFEHLGKIYPEASYDLYLSAAGQKPHVAVVAFFCNDTGSVSKLTILSYAKNQTSVRNAGLTLGSMLVSLGLSPSEIDVLMEKSRRKTALPMFGPRTSNGGSSWNTF